MRLARSSSASGRERAGQRSQRLGSAVGERALGFDVEDADDRASAPQRNRELGDDTRERGDVVRIRADVGRELRSTEPHRPARDPALDRDPVGDDRVPALGDEPEPSVLEDEDGRHDAGDRVVEAVDRSLDRARRLVVRRRRIRRRCAAAASSPRRSAGRHAQPQRHGP